MRRVDDFSQRVAVDMLSAVLQASATSLRSLTLTDCATLSRALHEHSTVVPRFLTELRVLYPNVKFVDEGLVANDAAATFNAVARTMHKLPRLRLLSLPYFGSRNAFRTELLALFELIKLSTSLTDLRLMGSVRCLFYAPEMRTHTKTLTLPHQFRRVEPPQSVRTVLYVNKLCHKERAFFVDLLLALRPLDLPILQQLAIFEWSLSDPFCDASYVISETCAWKIAKLVKFFDIS